MRDEILRYGAATGACALLSAAATVLPEARALVPVLGEALPAALLDDGLVAVVAVVAGEEVPEAEVSTAGLRVPGVTPKLAAVPGTAGVVWLVVCGVPGDFDVCARNGIIT